MRQHETLKVNCILQAVKWSMRCPEVGRSVWSDPSPKVASGHQMVRWQWASWGSVLEPQISDAWRNDAVPALSLAALDDHALFRQRHSELLFRCRQFESLQGCYGRPSREQHECCCPSWAFGLFVSLRLPCFEERGRALQEWSRSIRSIRCRRQGRLQVSFWLEAWGRLSPAPGPLHCKCWCNRQPPRRILVSCC